MWKIKGLNKGSLCVCVLLCVCGVVSGVLISSNKSNSNKQHNDAITNRWRHLIKNREKAFK